MSSTDVNVVSWQNTVHLPPSLQSLDHQNSKLEGSQVGNFGCWWLESCCFVWCIIKFGWVTLSGLYRLFFLYLLLVSNCAPRTAVWKCTAATSSAFTVGGITQGDWCVRVFILSKHICLLYLQKKDEKQLFTVSLTKSLSEMSWDENRNTII